MQTLIRLAALCSLILALPAAWAARLEIPLRVPFEVLRQALSAQLAASSRAPDVIYREGPCRYLKLQSPRIDAVDGQLRLIGPGSAALGVELLGACQNAAAWQGSMQFTFVPQLDAAGRLRLRIIDSRLSDDGNAPALGFIWELSKRQLHPRLERFSYDIGALRTALIEIMRAVAPPQQRAALEGALSQLQVLQPRVEANALVVPIALEIPDAWLAAAPSAPAAVAPLTEAELEALDQALQPLDAFLAYTIKQVALDNENSALRARLFTLLLDSRYQLNAILSGEETTPGDPVRALFIDAWNELRTILADAQLAPYAMFIDAGDALVALDRAAPGLGMQLSADGLRQLARSLRPGSTADPLAYDWAVDAQLRQLFEVQEIVLPKPTSALQPFTRVADLRALDRWLPTRSELPAYESRIGELLKGTAAIELQRARLAAPYDAIYRRLVPTTALVESCWRQYALRGGKVSYLRSAAASVGIMQVNQRVWRGFYEVERLRWDTAYNALAGAQILMRYVKDYAIPYAERSGHPNDVPRAAYAVYNAGPRAVGRFDKPIRHPREERVDERLWTLYQGIASGGQADLATCAVKQTSAFGFERMNFAVAAILPER
jgi:hypothetical protein